jgi:hypothetical protein
MKFFGIALAWEVFLEFEAQDYSQEGSMSSDFLDSQSEIQKCVFRRFASGLCIRSSAMR